MTKGFPKFAFPPGWWEGIRAWRYAVSGRGGRIAYANPLRGVGDVTSMAVISFFGYFMIAARSFAGAGLQ